ncbi:MAG: NAD-dependent epimerase/dehydratase family protein [Gemmatimonadales bacterium]|nr:MAG: NAD-dependent epimerase/dehydratase family protein [Gemmatimonadales bacterium]
MTPSRRDFLRTAGLLGAGLAGTGLASASLAGSSSLTGLPGTGVAAPGFAGIDSTPRPRTSLRLLVLGGTGFIGPHMVRYAVERGHRVTTFTRGQAESDLPAGVEQLFGDRNDDLSALEGRSWDVVLDNNARDYRWVQRSTALLREAAGHYVFVSTVSVFTDEASGYEAADQVLHTPVIHEGSPRHRPPPGFADGDEASYGLTKALGEDVAHAAFPGRATIVRPGLIVGPGDPTDRFTYWPRRIHQGGEVLAPGNPEHAKG